MSKEKSVSGTVGKALDVLNEFASIGRPARFSEVLAASKYPKTTLYRLLQTLTNEEMLSYDPEEQMYSLGVRLVRLAHAAWEQSSMAPIARPFVDALSHEVGLTVHLAQLDGGQVLYIDKRNSSAPIQMYSQAGKIGPAYCTGVGKAMMACLEEEALERVISQQSFHRYTEHTLTSAQDMRQELLTIKEEGVAFDREEHEHNIICIAAPILSLKGKLMGALSITTTRHRHSIDDLALFKDHLLDAAKQIGDEAEVWHFPDKL